MTSQSAEVIVVLATEVQVGDGISIANWRVTEVSRKENTVFLVVTGGRFGTKVISYPADTQVIVQR